MYSVLRILKYLNFSAAHRTLEKKFLSFFHSHLRDSSDFQDSGHKNSECGTWSDINSAPRRQRNNNINENFTLTKSQSSPFINFKVALSDLEMCSDSQLFAQSQRGLVKDSESPPTLPTCRSSFSNMTAAADLSALSGVYFLFSHSTEVVSITHFNSIFYPLKCVVGVLSSLLSRVLIHASQGAI